jgi:hypothetical protein
MTKSKFAYEYLAERSIEGLLDSKEQIELASLVRANTLIKRVKGRGSRFSATFHHRVD